MIKRIPSALLALGLACYVLPFIIVHKGTGQVVDPAEGHSLAILSLSLAAGALACSFVKTRSAIVLALCLGALALGAVAFYPKAASFESAQVIPGRAAGWYVAPIQHNYDIQAGYYMVWLFLLTGVVGTAVLRLPNPGNTKDTRVTNNGFCASCGSPVLADSKFCPKCGVAVAAATDKPSVGSKD